MAKSIRSKWKRKMRAIKRERYAKKELIKLKTILGIADGNTDVQMQQLADVVEITDAQSIKEQADPLTGYIDLMDTDKSDLNVKKDGKYPVWMHQRKIRSMARKNKQNKNKRRKKERKSRPKVRKNKGNQD